MSIIQTLKSNIKQLILGYSHFHPSFSQAGEDMILRNLFRRIENGFFVDIGAYHPVKGSNTYYLYKFSKWRGITIDPNPDVKDIFKKIRPDETHLSIGISCKPGLLTYYSIDKMPVMNSFSFEFLKEAGVENDITNKTEIETRTLEDVLDQYFNIEKDFHFLNIDAEGLDFEILKSNNWSKYRPWVIAIETENIEKKSETELFLENKEYYLFAKTPVNIRINSTNFYMDKKFKNEFGNY